MKHEHPPTFLSVLAEGISVTFGLLALFLELANYGPPTDWGIIGIGFILYAIYKRLEGAIP